MSLQSYQAVDRDQLAKDISDIHRQSVANTGIDDFKHLTKMERWGKACSILGYATAWIFPNPISALLISQGSFTRWTQVGHPIVHRAYNKIEGVDANYTSKHFAQGWRRFLDWPDWMTPAGWHHEHDKLHHYSLGEINDPNNAQHNMEWLRQSSLFTKQGQGLWLESILPYVAYRFVVIPLLFLPLGSFAVLSVLLNSILAEIFTNMHSFLVMMPNHTGDDVMMFDEKVKGKGEFYLRQILGSVNYPTGSNLNDFFYGWLNYQIEHHLWPDMPLSQYQKVQPQVLALCKKHNIPYLQESVFKRLLKAVRLFDPGWMGSPSHSPFR